MALAYLQILFIFLALVSLIGQFLLYKDKSTINNYVFFFNVFLGILFSWLVFTSLPTNFYAQKIISLVWGFLAFVAIGIKIFRSDDVKFSKILLTISVFGGMIHLFL